MKFLIDNQLPAALARFLASRGVECLHVLDVGLAGSTDAEIWEHAIHLDSVRELPHEDALGCNGECVAEGGGWIKSGRPHYRTPIAVGLAA